jgi:tyrosine-protein phosphatase SIW14
MKSLRYTLWMMPLALSVALPAWPGSLELPGVPNFHQINDHVFRSGQPADGSWQNLAKLGVKIVIDLRRPDEHSTAAEAQAVNAAGMQYINVPMKGVVGPAPDQMSRVLSILDSPDKVLVHCHRGADRTGAVIACYRISHDHWQNQQALAEAKALGMRWTQMGLKRFILSFQPIATAQRGSPEDSGL